MNNIVIANVVKQPSSAASAAHKIISRLWRSSWIPTPCYARLGMTSASEIEASHD